MAATPVAEASAVNGSGDVSVEKGVDFANYFCTYAFLYHQKEMLSDRVRMDAYYNAVFKNKHHFDGKVVLDVGAGSGILAIWSAQAGARKVYAVEATKMAEHARALVQANSVEDVVQVIEGSMEDVYLPEKVDVIISEWMGYFLLRESMFDSVICARDRWLKPTGVMYPSHARMWIAPARSGLGDQKMNDFDTAMSDWDSFVNEIETNYGVNMNVLTKAYHEEHEKYFLKTSMWNNLHPGQVIGTPAVIKEIDCLTATVDEIRNVTANFSIPINVDRTRLSAFAGWFDVHFRGSMQDPAEQEVELTTAPSIDNSTHWGQQRKYDDAIKECNKAVELNPSYVKALFRRGEAHESLEHYEEAIADMKEIIELEPSNNQAVRNIARLEPLAAEKREKMKEEMMGKLKDMGNNILGKFGMSLDNFKSVKDPNTGSYSISFQR